MKHKLTIIVIIALLCCTLSAVLFVVIVFGDRFTMLFNNEIYYSVEKGAMPSGNPYKGIAPWINHASGENDDVSLYFVLLKWSEIEPNEGEYEFDKYLSEKNEYANKAFEENAKLVVRIVCDYPTKEKHMDIPLWLYEKTSGDGQWYDNSYGQGFSPNYLNPIIIKEHQELIEAFAEYCKDNRHIAYVQLGSLGHWGEWHVNSSQGIKPFPRSSVSNKYVKPYLDGFDSKMLLMRRPDNLGNDYNVGLYNDDFANENSHDKWLTWISDGYESDQTNEWVGACNDYWKYAPSAGELTSAVPIEELLDKDFDRVLEYVGKSHSTFLGPHVGYSVEDETCRKNMWELNRYLGYCFRINTSSLLINKLKNSKTLKLEIENIGNAPIYQNVLLQLRIENDSDKTENVIKQSIDITALLPKEKNTVEIPLSLFMHQKGSYRVYASLVIEDEPDMYIKLANVSCDNDIYEYEVMNIDID